MVTWGQNTIHTFGTPAPTPAPFGTSNPAPAPSGSLFGSPAPAPSTSGLFGSSSPGTSLFGTPSAPAPSGGGLFGAPAPPPAGGGLFGSPTPGTSLFGGFGAAVAPSSTSLFGAPAPTTSLFGTPAPAPYGLSPYGLSPYGISPYGAPPAGPQQPQIPAQAALQAHMDASARQEAEKVRLALEALHCAYTGNVIPTTSGGSDKESSKFVTITYNDLTPAQRQLQWVHGMGTGGSGHLMAPPKPPQVSDSDWKAAVVKNPDPQNYMPVALVGAVALQGRVSWQQSRATELASTASKLAENHDMLQVRCARVRQDLESMTRRHATLRKKLLDVMRSVELARCMNQQIQPDELHAMERLRVVLREVDTTRDILLSLHDKARARPAGGTASSQGVTGIPDKAQLLAVFSQHREAITQLTSTAQKDLRDLNLIQNRVENNVPRIMAPRVV